MTRAIIVGGGITGLAAAYYLEKLSDVDILLLEGNARTGGKVATHSRDGFTIEEGPDCFFSKKPEALALIQGLGMAERLIEPLQRQFLILAGGVLHPVPSRLASFRYSDNSVVDEAGFLSAKGRDRAKLEHLQPAGTTEDETIASFFRRRFGTEFSQMLAEPLLAGTHGGGAERLSMQAIYPTYLDAERRFGSLAAAPSPSGLLTDDGTKPRPTFLSLRSGMGELAESLRSALRKTHIRTSAKVESIERNGVLAGGSFEEADVVLATTPSDEAADLIASWAPELAQTLRGIEFAPSTILTVAFAKHQIGGPLNATGFLVPEVEPGHISGCTFASAKWSGRAPEGSSLLRIFVRSGHLAAEALSQIRDLLSISGAPLIHEESHWQHGLPQYRLGHLDRMAAIQKQVETMPTLFLAGTSYDGVGVPDCIRQAKIAAENIAKSL